MPVEKMEYARLKDTSTPQTVGLVNVSQGWRILLRKALKTAELENIPSRFRILPLVGQMDAHRYVVSGGKLPERGIPE